VAHVPEAPDHPLDGSGPVREPFPWELTDKPRGAPYWLRPRDFDLEARHVLLMDELRILTRRKHEAA
jgi:hypothetical protein